jgi:TPR repeat protein
MYSKAEGVPRDEEEGSRWYLMGAERGDTYARESIGYRYMNAVGVPLDFRKAERFSRFAADAGSPAAMVNLGWLYYFGHGVPQSGKLALEWTLKAASQDPGLGQAPFNLGVYYRDGINGVPRDYVQAYVWFTRAAWAGMVQAQDRTERVAERMTPEETARARDLLGLQSAK